MFKIDQNYSQYRDDNDPNYPGGAAVDAPFGDSIEGTQIDKRFFNQIFGFFQAAIIDAFGSLTMISGSPDNANESDVLDALKEISRKVTDQIQSLVNQNIADIILNFAEHLDLSAFIRSNEARITVLENSLYMDVVANPFLLQFLDLDGVNIIRGNWNETTHNVECTRYGDDLFTSFNSIDKIELISGIWNAPCDQLEC